MSEIDRIIEDDNFDETFSELTSDKEFIAGRKEIESVCDDDDDVDAMDTDLIELYDDENYLNPDAANIFNGRYFNG